MPIVTQSPANSEHAPRKLLSASLPSVRLETYFRGIHLATASGFIDISSHGPVLVTNRHVMTGRNHFTGAPIHPDAVLPDECRIWYLLRSGGAFETRSEVLYDRDLWPRWNYHAKHGGAVDIATLPLTNIDGISLFPRSGWVESPVDWPMLLPTDPVAVVGYPYGKHATGFPVWTSGTIATDPELDYDEKPVFLIDARTRQSQSGSPVYYHTNTGVVRTSTGVTNFMDAPYSWFLGIYSGRINAESDVGMVWKAHLVSEILESGTPAADLDPEHTRDPDAKRPQ